MNIFSIVAIACFLDNTSITVEQLCIHICKIGCIARVSLFLVYFAITYFVNNVFIVGIAIELYFSSFNKYLATIILPITTVAPPTIHGHEILNEDFSLFCCCIFCVLSLLAFVSNSRISVT